MHFLWMIENNHLFVFSSTVYQHFLQKRLEVNIKCQWHFAVIHEDLLTVSVFSDSFVSWIINELDAYLGEVWWTASHNKIAILTIHKTRVQDNEASHGNGVMCNAKVPSPPGGSGNLGVRGWEGGSAPQSPGNGNVYFLFHLFASPPLSSSQADTRQLPVPINSSR